MRERYLRAAALSGDKLDPVNLGRVRNLLSQAYLVAIAPQLQRATRAKRTQTINVDKAAQALQHAFDLLATGRTTSNFEGAKRIFQSKCSQCHDLKQIDDSPPKTDQQVRSLVSRMVGEGLSGTPEELAAIMWYLGTKYVR
jgi:cytochrome c5